MKQLKSKKSDLVSLADLTREDLKEILELTNDLKLHPEINSNVLGGKSIALIFAKPSLRTRVSFEVAITGLGGNPITIKMEEISVGIRENVEDIANVLSRYVSAIVIRTFEQEQVRELASHASIPVINGLSDDEHPCQVISDLFTIKELFGKLSSLKLAYVGDGNNVAQSLLIGSALADINISIAAPKTHFPKEHYVNLAKKINPKINVEVTDDPKTACSSANIIYTDVWVSMGQEEKIEDRRKVFDNYQINDKLISFADKNAKVLHCLPAHKGEEITKEVFERFSNVIYTQAENRLHAQKAILLKLLGNA